eukprot:COSAG02_NODE_3768_length_6264_cov_5.702676_6_plen_94_part_00
MFMSKAVQGDQPDSNWHVAQATPLSPTPHNATAGDPGKLPGQYSYLSACPRHHPGAAELASRHYQSDATWDRLIAWCIDWGVGGGSAAPAPAP